VTAVDPASGLAALLLAVVGILAGGVAAIAGFGIGSLLTPALGAMVDTKLAVAAVAVPHFLGTLLRFWILRRHIERRLLLGFGAMSAIGGLLGAWLYTVASSRALGYVFGSLLLVAGTLELTGVMRRIRWGRRSAWIAGGVSGLLGGMVGNQGGIRSASLLGFEVPKQSFVATATAIALFVDGARLPVYLVTTGSEMAPLWPQLLLTSVGVMVGTLVGIRLLRRLPEATFRRGIAVLLLGLGLYFLSTSARGS
jgi:uncharacterized protein